MGRYKYETSLTSTQIIKKTNTFSLYNSNFHQLKMTSIFQESRDLICEHNLPRPKRYTKRKSLRDCCPSKITFSNHETPCAPDNSCSTIERNDFHVWRLEQLGRTKANGAEQIHTKDVADPGFVSFFDEVDSDEEEPTSVKSALREGQGGRLLSTRKVGQGFGYSNECYESRSKYTGIADEFQDLQEGLTNAVSGTVPANTFFGSFAEERSNERIEEHTKTRTFDRNPFVKALQQEPTRR